jgi:hypothetical protein
MVEPLKDQYRPGCCAPAEKEVEYSYVRCDVIVLCNNPTSTNPSRSPTQTEARKRERERERASNNGK